MTETVRPSEKPQKHRSPSYPAIDLRTAVSRAGEISKIAGNREVPMAVVIKQWGYGAKSSNGILTVAALKKYGLTTDTGRGELRKLQLTRLGQEILFFSEETGEWLQRVQQAAVTPTIYRELWQKYGPDLPDDKVMLYDLTFERGFSDAAAKDVLRLFRATVAYAHLADAGDILIPDGEESDDPSISDEDQEMTTPTLIEDVAPSDKGTRSRSKRAVQITYSPNEWALLQGQFPMSEDDWDAMIAVLQAMKRGLVEPND
jgi:hypothetical protein